MEGEIRMNHAAFAHKSAFEENEFWVENNIYAPTPFVCIMLFRIYPLRKPYQGGII